MANLNIFKHFYPRLILLILYIYIYSTNGDIHHHNHIFVLNCINGCNHIKKVEFPSLFVYIAQLLLVPYHYYWRELAVLSYCPFLNANSTFKWQILDWLVAVEGFVWVELVLLGNKMYFTFKETWVLSMFCPPPLSAADENFFAIITKLKPGEHWLCNLFKQLWTFKTFVSKVKHLLLHRVCVSSNILISSVKT